MIRVVAAAVSVLLLASPAHASQKLADREALKAAIDDILTRRNISAARVGVEVMSLDDGSVIYTRNADDLLNPASNVKLFTTAAALARLGPEYRFDTEFLLDKQNPAKPHKLGEFQGNLYVRGKGDPTILTEKLWGIVQRLRFQGLRSFSGDIVLDDSYFDAQSVGPGFDQERSDRAYMAPTGALSLNWNTVGVYVTPADAVGAKARVEVSPASDYFVVENRVETTSVRGLRRVDVVSVPEGKDKQRIVVTGRVPVNQAPLAIWKKIDYPAVYFGQTLKSFLANEGVKFKGKVRVGAVPKDAVPYLVNQSETLDLVLKRVNKNSSNFTAEQLVKTMGAQFAGVPGSWPNGIAVVEDFLSTEVGIARGTFVMKNGSGLNDTNRFSADQTCRLLRAMWQRFPLAPEYLSSLGIAGKDGTLAFRMDGTDAVGRLRAKTGTLENVSALSGYVQAVGGEKFAFAIMVNDFPARQAIVASIDAVGAAIADLGTAGGPAQGVAQALGEAPQPGPMEDLMARVATCATVSKMRDPRNVTFLRTTLKATRDPAIKAVLADAIYRIEPDGWSGVRALLDYFNASPDVLGRLREVARTTSSATPVLDSVIRVAAEGNLEALSVLVEVAAQALTDEGLLKELMEPLAEVARNAPAELIVSLRATPNPTQSAAVAVLAKSLVNSGERDHPFPAALKKAQDSTDPQLASFAKALDEELSSRMAAEKTEPSAPQPTAVPAGASKG